MTLLIETKGIDPRLKVVRPSLPLFLNCLIDSIKVLFKVEMYKFEGQRVWERHTLFWRNLRSSSAFFLPIRGGTIPIPNNHNSGSLGYFGGIGTRIGSKGIIKGIEKESFSDSQLLILQTGRKNSDSRLLNLSNRATSILGVAHSM